jgi:hypothetical protein
MITYVSLRYAIQCRRYTISKKFKRPFEAEEERERRESGGVAIGTTFNGRGEHKFRLAATKVPRQCPLVLLVKVGLVKVRRLEVEKVR